MAWALQFDGVNDYATLDSTVSFANTGEYLIEIKIKIDATPVNSINSVLWFDLSNYFYYRTSNELFFWQFGGSNRSVSALTGDVLGKVVTVYLKQDAAGAKSIEVVGGNTSAEFTSLRTFDFNQFVRDGNWELDGGILEVIIYSDLARTTIINHWDATSSSHAAGTPVLVDTISGNDATGVNMPTDGSAWVDLGGGGISIPVIMNQLRNQGIS